MARFGRFDGTLRYVLETSDVVDVETGLGRYRLPVQARDSHLLRELFLEMHERTGHFTVALHRQGSPCRSVLCHDPGGGGDADSPRDLGPDFVTMSDAALEDLVDNVVHDLGILVDLVALLGGDEAADRLQRPEPVPLLLVASPHDSCEHRRWLVLPDVTDHLVDAVVARCVVSDDAPPVPDRQLEALADARRGAAERVAALDSLGRLQFEMICADPEALLIETLLDGRERLGFDGDADRFELDLGNHMEVVALEPPLPSRIVDTLRAYWGGVYKDWSVVAAARDEPDGRHWQLTVAGTCACGGPIELSVPGVSYGLFQYTPTWDEQGEVVRVPWSWVPAQGQRVEAAVGFWATHVRAAGAEDAEGVMRDGEHLVITGCLSKTPDLNANRLDGTRFWKLPVSVPVLCNDPLCAAGDATVDFDVIAPWDGDRFGEGDVIVVRGQLTVEVSPQDPAD
jgi:hypothetical protein